VKAIVVYDDTALVQHFNDTLSLPHRYWREADRGERTIVFPTCAMAVASTTLGATEDDWRIWLDVPSVHAADLTVTAAVAISRWSGDFATRHVVYEQQTTRGSLILTAAPDRYASLGLPILPA
jgi:hypothetical protein